MTDPLQALVAWRWPDGKAQCPHCDSHRVGYVRTRSRYKCRDCRRQFSVTSGTEFHAAKLPVNKLLLLIACREKAASAIDLSAQVGVDYGTAWQRMAQHLRGLKKVPPRGRVDRGRRASAMSAGTAETATQAQGEARQRDGEAGTPK